VDTGEGGTFASREYAGEARGKEREREREREREEEEEREREKEIETDGAATALLRGHKGNRGIG